jgi:hypothetical protein
MVIDGIARPDDDNGMEPDARGRAQRPTMRLVGLGGSAPREVVIAEGRTRVGSADDNDLVIAESTVSRRHAEIHRWRARCVIKDLGSTNGTFLNGVRLGSRARIKGGDEICFGTVRFVAHDPTVRTHNSRLRLRTAIEILIALFVLGFGVTEYFLVTGGPRHPSEKPAARPIIKVVALHSTSPPVPAGASAGAATEDAGPVPEWLAWLNHYRAIVDVPVVGEDPALSAGDVAHARYLVENYGDAVARGVRPGAEMHTENPGTPGYSEAGLKAASASDVAQWAGHGGVHFSPRGAIDGWMSIPFHRLPILSPRLKRAGYGQYCGPANCAAALNVLTDSEPLHPIPTLFKNPIEFPADGSTIALKTAGLEWPDPLTSCAGYALPTGPPITLQLGSWYQPTLSTFSVKRDGADIEACGFDANSYTNPDAAVQKVGRGVLRDYGAVVVIPREPFIAGSTYAVTMTVDGKPYKWSFKLE